MKEYLPVPRKTNEIAVVVVEAAFKVHKTLGSGLMESVYEAYLMHELNLQGLRFETQVAVPIIHEGISMPCHPEARFTGRGICTLCQMSDPFQIPPLRVGMTSNEKFPTPWRLGGFLLS